MLGNFKYSNPKYQMVAGIYDIFNHICEQEAAEAGLAAMEEWMKEVGVVLDAKAPGVTEDLMGDIVDATFILDGGYKTLTRDDVIEIFRECCARE